MRYLPLFALFLLLACRRDVSTPKQVLCHMPGDGDATATFASLADDPAFRNAHPSPQPVEVDHAGQHIEFPVEGGANGRGYLMRAHGNTNKYLLLFHEWWGLNDNIKRETSLWCHELGINVLAIDLYDGRVVNTADEAGQLMQANDPARSSAIIAGAVKHLGDNADFRTMGWCFGGGWSLRAALQLGDRAKGCVVYYGAPEQEVEKLKTLGTDVVFIHPTRDKWITETMTNDFEKNMTAAGKKVKVFHYDADHAFANPSSPRYNEQAARDARSVVMAYLSTK